MKLDLDDLERKLRGREGCPDLDPMWPTPAGPRGPILCVIHPDCRCGREDRRLATAAASPAVVLAMIARIRELEGEANNAAALLEAKSDLAARREWAKALRERVAKGAVLP